MKMKKIKLEREKNSLTIIFYKKLKQSIISFSSLGSLSLYLAIIVFLFIIDFTNEAYILVLAFLLQYSIGLPIRANMFKNRLNPKHHAEIYQESRLITFSSFPSFHATRIIILSWMLIHILSYSIEIILFSTLLTILVCYSRILLQRHYITDILGGVFFGSILWSISFNIISAML